MNRVLKSFMFGLLLAVLAHAQNQPISIQESCDATKGRNLFEKIGNGYYLFSTVKLSWIEAAHYCRTKGAQLASLEYVDEQYDLSEYLMQKSSRDIYWISANDQGEEGTFKWLGTGKEFTNINTFDWGIYSRPGDSSSNEDCVSLSPEQGRHILNDDNCTVEYYFVCEASVVSFFNS